MTATAHHYAHNGHASPPPTDGDKRQHRLLGDPCLPSAKVHSTSDAREVGNARYRYHHKARRPITSSNNAGSTYQWRFHVAHSDVATKRRTTIDWFFVVIRVTQHEDGSTMTRDVTRQRSSKPKTKEESAFNSLNSLSPSSSNATGVYRAISSLPTPFSRTIVKTKDERRKRFQLPQLPLPILIRRNRRIPCHIKPPDTLLLLPPLHFFLPRLLFPLSEFTFLLPHRSDGQKRVRGIYDGGGGSLVEDETCAAESGVEGLMVGGATAGVGGAG